MADDLVESLRIVSGMLQMGERITFGRDSQLMSEAADEIERLRDAFNGEIVSSGEYEIVLADHRRLVRELDVALNGEAGAAQQASLCDIVGQVKDERWKLVRGD